MAEIKVDENIIATFVQKAIYESLSEDTKKELLVGAIKESFREPKDRYGSVSGRSPIQQAFDIAVERSLREYAMSKLKDDADFQTKLEALFKDVAKKLFEEKREEIVGAFAAQIIKSINGDRY